MGSWNKRNVIFCSVVTNWLVYQLTTLFLISSDVPRTTDVSDVPFLENRNHLPSRTSQQRQQQQQRKQQQSKKHQSAALCAFAKDEEPYLDEWVDYHLGMGFESVIIYDNSDKFDLKGWNEKRPGKNITIKHWPGTFQQRLAYSDCVYNHTKIHKHTWTGFWDIDEFLVLKKHNTVLDFLEDHCQNGSIAINWFIFTMGNQTLYEPLPVTKRFQYRIKAGHHNTKVIVKTQDFRGSKNPHACSVRKGTNQHDTSGNIITSNSGAANRNRPMTVAALHHYRYKSKKEWYYKGCVRGMVTGAKPQCKESLKDMQKAKEVFDDSAWKLLKQNVPKYQVFDKWLET
jgi:hypothetical protein